ncbi:hypothetical protein D9M68_405350 [compost metagenome]
MVAGIGDDAGRSIARLQCVVLFHPGLAHDVDGGKIVEEQRVRCAQDKVDGILVHLLDTDNGGEVFAVARAGIDLALDRCHHVVGVEGLALMKLHALAQLEAPARGLDDFPGRGKRRLQLQILVAAHQRIENHVVNALGETVDLSVRVVGNDIAG